MATHNLEKVLEIVDNPDGAVDLAEAALLIAREEYPRLPVSDYLGRISLLAENVSRRLPTGATASDILFTLNEYLFQEEGFVGNTLDWYDPRNSFLNDVLDFRRGVPVTLAIVYIAVGRTLGLPLEGVAFPGHFLVRCHGEGERVILDPFAGGTLLQRRDLERLLDRVYRGEPPPMTVDALLAPAQKRDVVLRMLRNLKTMYLEKNRPEKALWPIEYILRLAPEQTDELRDRGILYEHLQHYRAAAIDYRHYLERVHADSEDATEIRHRLIDLQYTPRLLH